MREQTCCFTGHRVIPEGQYDAIKKRLEDELLGLILQGVHYFYAGGALGFDTMAALTVLEFRLQYPCIKLFLALPCRNQSKSRQSVDRCTYDMILANANDVLYISEVYYRGCMQKRNRYMVERSGVCLCYLTDTHSGTAYTVDYARQKGLRIIGLSRES